MALGCSSGRHGENCSRPCPDHCLDNSCHIETGLCFGCKEGYLGVTCEKRTYSKLKALLTFVHHY